MSHQCHTGIIPAFSRYCAGNPGRTPKKSRAGPGRGGRLGGGQEQPSFAPRCPAPPGRAAWSDLAAGHRAGHSAPLRARRKPCAGAGLRAAGRASIGLEFLPHVVDNVTGHFDRANREAAKTGEAVGGGKRVSASPYRWLTDVSLSGSRFGPVERCAVLPRCLARWNPCPEDVRRLEPSRLARCFGSPQSRGGQIERGDAPGR